MSEFCLFCSHADNSKINEDKERWCDLTKSYVRALGHCPGFIKAEQTTEQKELAEKAYVKPIEKPVEQKPITPKKSLGHSQVTVKERDDVTEIKLYEHQIVARGKFKDKNEIALFFEMGCGKTLTSMMIICDKYKAGIIDSLLVVAPNDVHKQWFDDLCDDTSVLSKAIAQEGVECTGQIIGGRGGQKQFYEFSDDNKLHIVCVNIDTFSTPEKWKPVVEWANANKTAIIVDEATVIKNPNSKRSQRMLYEFNNVMKRGKTILKSEKINPVRIVLTGTPVTNGPMDLWAIMEFIKPNYFGRNYFSFMNYYGMHTKLTVNDRTISVLLTEKTWKAIHDLSDFTEAACLFGCTEETYLTIKHQDHFQGPYKHGDELKKLLEPNSVFAQLTDCVDMPEKNYVIKRVPLSPAQESCYKSMQHDLLAEFDEHVATAKNKMTVMMRLQQIASGYIMAHKEVANDDVPFWDDDAYDVTPDEVVWLDDVNPRLEQLMRDVDESSKPLIIITRFSAEAAKIYDLLKDKYECMLYTGWKTVGDMTSYKQGKYDIVIANIVKIARGHNLQIGHSTIFYSNTFSMELRQQTEFRTFRIGQKNICNYIDYVSCGADEGVLASLKMKKNFLDYIRDKDISEVM